MTIVTPVAKADAFPRGTAVVIVSYDGRFAGRGRVQSFLPGSVYSVELTGGYNEHGKPFRVGSIEFFHAGFVARVEEEAAYTARFELRGKLLDYQEAFLVATTIVGLRHINGLIVGSTGVDTSVPVVVSNSNTRGGYLSYDIAVTFASSTVLTVEQTKAFKGWMEEALERIPVADPIYCSDHVERCSSVEVVKA